MVNFTVDEMRQIMGRPKNVRNLSVIAHVDHGKSTLTDSLVSKAGIIASQKAGDARYTDTRADEQERCITIKSTGISMYFKRKENGEDVEYLMNLIDSPGHVDFSSEVTAALRVTDGAITVVDAVDGVCVQTETVLRQALSEFVKPVLHINKVDRAILELVQAPEDIYQRCIQTIENVNVTISTYQSTLMGELQVSPEKGVVSFGSGLQGWAFTLKDFAKYYAARFNVDENKFIKKLWGENFYEPKTKTWHKTRVPDSVRGFVQFIMEPIVTLSHAVLNEKTEQVEKMLTALKITLTSEDRASFTGKHLLRRIMQLWLPAGDCLLNLIVDHLPSPVEAQKYKFQYLYMGPPDDECAIGIRDCDPNAPLMMYISKMIPAADKGRFYAFGRVLSGTVATGQKVRIQNPNYEPSKKAGLFEKTIMRTVIMMGRFVEHVADIPAGNTGCLVGVDKYLAKTGTITTHPDAYNIRDMKYSVSPVVRVSVRPKDSRDLPKFTLGIQKLLKSDPLVLADPPTETTPAIIYGCGELHMEICMKDLREDYAQCEIIVEEPVVAYREGVSTQGSKVLAKSPNNHNRMYLVAEPLHEDLVNELETGAWGPQDDIKLKANHFADKYNFDKNHVIKIWAYGPNNTGPNFFIDGTAGIQYMNEIKDHCVAGFQTKTATGVLCDEPMRGVRFTIVDCTLHADAIHRGGSQIVPQTQKAMMAAQLTAVPILFEPMYCVDIVSPQSATSGIYEVLSNRRGIVVHDNVRYGTPLHEIRAHLPMAESFGFTGLLREKTSGQAFPQCNFDHWAQLRGDALMVGDPLNKIVSTIRKRKGLSDQPFPLSRYADTL